MDIHKPKPWHGVREFLKEYLIIVVGVLTALGAEQGVEWLHWRHLAERAEADLAAGLGPDLVNAYTFVVIESCGRARVTELAAALQKPGPDWRASPMPSSVAMRESYGVPQAYYFIGRLWSHAAWDTALSSGVLNHMPHDRVARYADLYRIVDSTSTIQRATNTMVTHLAPLAYDRKLSDAEKDHYLELVSEVAAASNNFAAASRSMLKGAHELGVDPPAEEVAAVLKRQHDGRGACVTDVKLPLS